MRPLIVIDTPPTPNGDLHVGHLAGPFIHADAYARYARAAGRQVVFSTGTDDSQTYVLASARRRGMEPAALAEASARGIERTLDEMAISIDGFAGYDDGYRKSVLDFVTPLHAAGKFELRRVRLPYSESTGEFLVEGLVNGYCPVCLIESRGGLCETCGHPNNFDELIDPHSTMDPAATVTHREVEILVLPLERYRDQLTAYYAARRPVLRPHTVALIDELLARPLPDFPITYPIGWGIPAPFPETPGQTINAWVEGMPAAMYTTFVAAANLGHPGTAADELWRAEHDAEVIYFIGFDNVYFWGITHIALLMAHDGRYVLPDRYLTNEFYELENSKFSTSLGHVLYSRDLLTEVPRDLVRFYLALTCPEHQRTNFSRTGLDTVVTERLVEPWNRLSGALAKAVADQGAAQRALPVSATGRGYCTVMLDRFRTCYELETFSLTRATELIVGYLDRLQHTAAALVEPVPMNGTAADAETRAQALGDLFVQVRALVAGASPVLTDLAAATEEASGAACDFRPETYHVQRVSAFPLPALRAGGRTA
jgi:methionyl-tRNA synthetase